MVIPVSCLVVIIVPWLIVKMITMSIELAGMIIIVAGVMPEWMASSIVVRCASITSESASAVVPVTISQIDVDSESPRFSCGSISDECQPCYCNANDQ